MALADANERCTKIWTGLSSTWSVRKAEQTRVRDASRESSDNLLRTAHIGVVHQRVMGHVWAREKLWGEISAKEQVKEPGVRGGRRS